MCKLDPCYVMPGRHYVQAGPCYVMPGRHYVQAGPCYVMPGRHYEQAGPMLCDARETLCASWAHVM